MQTFPTARDAKEFLVSKIVTEAQRERVQLSEVERKMLYFSETAWTLPDIADVNDAFDRDYDQREYEQKIATLSRNFCVEAGRDNPEDLHSWKAAVEMLRQEDHYLLVLVGAGNAVPRATPWLKLLVIGVSLAILALAMLYLFISR